MPLTDTAVRKAKPADRPIKLSDGGGMYLLVKPDGALYWRMDYRWNGRRGTLAFGVYPTVTLADARDSRSKAKKQLAAGIDPAAQKKLDRLVSETASRNTFRVIADEWLDKCAREGTSPNTLSKLTWLLSFTDSAIGSRPISDITAMELLGVLRQVEGRGRYDTARRLATLSWSNVARRRRQRSGRSASAGSFPNFSGNAGCSSMSPWPPYFFMP
jgi:hypothetical protein